MSGPSLDSIALDRTLPCLGESGKVIGIGRPSRPLEVWALLPQTNCKACGESTCMAFAFGLVQARHRPEDCPPLQAEPAFAERRAALESIF